VVELWDTISGVDELRATTLVAEMGGNMDQFPSAGHTAKWAGSGTRKSRGSVSPGRRPKAAFSCYELSAKRPGLPRAPETYLAAQYHHLIVRKSKKKTIIAVAHTMLTIAYYITKRQCPYIGSWEEITSIGSTGILCNTDWLRS